jgi:hemoglobin
MGDPRLGRFWQHRAEDSLRREKQLLIDFLCSAAGGSLLYLGRDSRSAVRVEVPSLKIYSTPD